MEQVWEDEAPAAAFFRKLLNSRVDSMLASPEWLRSLRYDHEMVRWWNKRAGHIFEERGLNLYELIASSHGECWDDEDEQKTRHAVEENVLPPVLKEKPRQTKEDALSLDHPCESGVRKGEEEECKLHVRPGDEGRQEHVQARSGREELYRRAGGSPQKAPAKKKKPSEEIAGGRGVKTHTKGLGNVEEGRNAEKSKPKKKRQRKRPVLGNQYKIQN